MSRRLSSDIIQKIRLLREKGWSLPEIKKKFKLGHGTIYKYIKGVRILPRYYKLWFGKRGGSIKRKKQAEAKAKIKAQNLVSFISNKEKAIFLSALYWGEGSKSDFGLSNTDPKLVKVFVKGLREVFGVMVDDLKVSIRIYEDLNKQQCLKYWSDVTGVPIDKFINVNVLRGRKQGKLSYGMCRIRVKKGGDLLKYITALKNEVVRYF